jgi:hypothetical protein
MLRYTLVSLIVCIFVDATTVPVIEPILTDTVNVSAPSVVTSATGLIVNCPVLFVMVNVPEPATKSLVSAVE